MMKSIIPQARKHDISFHASGKVDISARIARRLSLAPGDVIDIVQEFGELYLYVRLRSGYYSGRFEGTVCATSKGRGTFRCWSKAITDAVMRMAKPDTTTLRCPCGDQMFRDGEKYITIIYRLHL